MPVLVGLDIKPLHAGFSGDGAEPIVIVGKKLTQRPAPVEQEPFRLLGTADHLPRQGRKPREQVVSPPFLEFPEHVAGPRHLSGFIAVGQEILDRGPFVDPEEILEITLPGFRVQFVHFQSGRLRRSRMILLSGQGDAETVDAPPSFRDLPDQRTVLVDQTEVLDRHHGILALRRQIIGEIMGRGKSRLVFRMIHLYDTMQDKLGDFPVTLHDKTEMLAPGSRDVHRQDGQTGSRDVTDLPPDGTVIADFQVIVISGRIGAPLVTAVTAPQRQGPDQLRPIERILDPAGPVVSGHEFLPIREIAIGEL